MARMAGVNPADDSQSRHGPSCVAASVAECGALAMARGPDERAGLPSISVLSLLEGHSRRRQATLMAHDADTRAEAQSAPDGQVPPIHSAAITLLGSAFGGLLTILGEVLAARLLEVQDYGLYATAMTVARVG